MEDYICKGRFTEKLKYACLIMMSLALSRDLIVYKVKPSVRVSDLAGLRLRFG